jgi:hypothetical protein
MRDGQIMHDEKTALGRVAITARKVFYTLSADQEEDTLAGVSALMKGVPDKPAPVPKRAAKKAKRTKKTKTVSRRAK